MKQTYQHIFQATVVALAFITLLIGCRQEVTRKADWEANFTDLHFADAERGWIVGEKGLIIHTKNSGKTWERQEVGTEGDFKAIYFANPRYGWAVGDRGLIATTDDGGRHWHLQE